MTTRDRILATSLDLFGSRGVDAVSLDEIARAVGVRKQTVLYWFESKDALVDEVLAVAATELVVVIDAALRAAPDDPLDRIDAVVRAVFRPAVRRPALLGLIREVSRLESEQATRLRERLQSLIDRAVGYLAVEMEAGRLRRGDPGTRRCARLCHPHRHRHRTRSAPRRRLAARRRRSAPPSRRTPRLPPRRPRPLTRVAMSETPGYRGFAHGWMPVSAWCCGGGGRGVRARGRRGGRSARCSSAPTGSTVWGTSRSA